MSRSPCSNVKMDVEETVITVLISVGLIVLAVMTVMLFF